MPPLPLFPPLRLTSSIRPNGTRFPAPGQCSRQRVHGQFGCTKSTDQYFSTRQLLYARDRHRARGNTRQDPRGKARSSPRPEPPAAASRTRVATGTAAALGDRRGIGIRLSGGNRRRDRTAGQGVPGRLVCPLRGQGGLLPGRDRRRPGAHDRPGRVRDAGPAGRGVRRGGTPGRVPSVPRVLAAAAFTRVFSIHMPTAGPGAVDRLDAAAGLFADLNQKWHQRAREHHPEWPSVPSAAYLALAGATDELVRSRSVRAGPMLFPNLKKPRVAASSGPGGLSLAAGNLIGQRWRPGPDLGRLCRAGLRHCGQSRVPDLA